jgi:hypothetical protein
MAYSASADKWGRPLTKYGGRCRLGLADAWISEFYLSTKSSTGRSIWYDNGRCFQSGPRQCSFSLAESLCDGFLLLVLPQSLKFLLHKNWLLKPSVSHYQINFDKPPALFPCVFHFKSIPNFGPSRSISDHYLKKTYLSPLNWNLWFHITKLFLTSLRLCLIEPILLCVLH